jgi:peptide chain release factor 1
MIEKIEEIKLRFEEVGQLLMQPETMTDVKKFSQLGKEYKDLEKIVTKYNQLKAARGHLQQAKDVLAKEKDAELRELAKMEIDELEPKIEQLDTELKELLIPKDPNDDKNVLLEIRAGTGGDEAAIFAGDVLGGNRRQSIGGDCRAQRHLVFPRLHGRRVVLLHLFRRRNGIPRGAAA